MNFLNIIISSLFTFYLIGDLTRHRRRLVRSFERLGISSPEQRTTANSERRMGILKRTQLGKIKTLSTYLMNIIYRKHILSLKDEEKNMKKLFKLQTKNLVFLLSIV